MHFRYSLFVFVVLVLSNIKPVYSEEKDTCTIQTSTSVRDECTREPLDSIQITIKDEHDSIVYVGLTSVGNLDMELQLGIAYKAICRQILTPRKYFTSCFTFTLKNKYERWGYFFMRPFVECDTTRERFKDIHFATNSAKLNDTTYLNQVCDYLNKLPDWLKSTHRSDYKLLIIHGRSNCMEVKKGRLDISLLRANTVIDYLVMHGIDKKRLKISNDLDNDSLFFCDCHSVETKNETEIDCAEDRCVSFEMLFDDQKK